MSDITGGGQQSVRMVPFDEAERSLPNYDPESDLVVFPSEGSVCWSELPREELAAVRRIILIDSRRGKEACFSQGVIYSFLLLACVYVGVILFLHLSCAVDFSRLLCLFHHYVKPPPSR